MATGGSIDGVSEGILRRLASEGDAVALRCRVGDGAAEGYLLAELVVDAAAILEIEDAVAAAQDGLSGSVEVVGEADARREVGEVVVDDAAGDAADAGELDGAVERIQSGLAVVLFGGEGEEIVAEAKIESEAVVELPVVLDEAADLVVAGSKEAALGAEAVVIDEAGEQLGWLVPGEVAVSDLEEALSGDGTEKGDVATDAAATELEGVVAVDVADRVVDLVGVFGDGVEAVVAGVLKLVVVATYERSAAERGGSVGVDDAEVLGDGEVCEDGRVGEGVPVVTDTELIENVSGEGVGLTYVVAAGVDVVGARGEAGRQQRQARGTNEGAVVVRRAEEDLVGRTEAVVEPDIKGVGVPDVAANGAEVVLGSID